MIQIETWSSIDKAKLLQVARQRFRPDLDLTFDLEQMLQIDQPPDRRRVAVVHRRQRQRHFQQLVTGCINEALPSPSRSIAQTIASLSEVAISPLGEVLLTTPRHLMDRAQRSKLHQRQNQMRPVTDTRVTVAFGQGDEIITTVNEGNVHG